MIDLTEYTDDDLDALRVAVLTEKERRATIAAAPDMAAALNARYAQAIGRQDGDPWAQPTGAHDAYMSGAIVTYGGKAWESLTPANVWEPGVSGWREVPEDDTPPEWVQPTGGHDAYNIGDLVTFEGAVYRSLIDGNTWSPSAYPAGWEVVTG